MPKNLRSQKKNRGLFGYKSVTEVYAEGRHTLTCLDPGFSGCKTTSLSFSDGTSITNEDFELIDQMVDKQIIENRKESGTIVIGSKYKVEFKYLPMQDVTNYTIEKINN